MELLSRTCNTDRMNVERLIARAFVIVGGLFWIVMYFGANTKQHYADLVYSAADIEKAMPSALLPLAVTIVVFVLGLFYERLTAVVLLALAAGIVAYGAIAQWNGAGLWMTILTLVVAPMVIAAMLYWLAGRMQQVCLLEQKTAS